MPDQTKVEMIDNPTVGADSTLVTNAR